MNNEILTKVAELSSYLDKKGHKEESHILDHRLMKLAEPKTLAIGKKNYTSAASAWRDYTSEGYQRYASALGTGRTNSAGIKKALDAYFGAAPVQPGTEVSPGQEISGEGQSKAVEPEWYDPRGWDPASWGQQAAEYAKGLGEPAIKERREKGTAGIPGGEEGVSGFGGRTPKE